MHTDQVVEEVMILKVLRFPIILINKSNSNLFHTSAEKQAEGVKYLSQIYFLSKCTSFVAGNTRGSLGVMLMMEGFENEYIFDLGLYK